MAKERRIALFQLLQKKGDKTLCDSYRGVKKNISVVTAPKGVSHTGQLDF